MIARLLLIFLLGDVYSGEVHIPIYERDVLDILYSAKSPHIQEGAVERFIGLKRHGETTPEGLKKVTTKLLKMLESSSLIWVTKKFAELEGPYSVGISELILDQLFSRRYGESLTDYPGFFEDFIKVADKSNIEKIRTYIVKIEDTRKKELWIQFLAKIILHKQPETFESFAKSNLHILYPEMLFRHLSQSALFGDENGVPLAMTILKTYGKRFPDSEGPEEPLAKEETLHPFVSEFISQLNSKFDDKQCEAAAVLLKFPPMYEKAAHRLVELLKDEKHRCRVLLAKTLLRLREKAKPVLSELESLQTDHEQIDHQINKLRLILRKKNSQKEIESALAGLNLDEPNDVRFAADLVNSLGVSILKNSVQEALKGNHFAQKLIENLRDHITEQRQKELDAMVENTFLNQPAEDPCSFLCEKIGTAEDWKRFETGPLQTLDSWGLAQQAIQLFTLAKSSARCPNAKNILDGLISSWLPTKPCEEENKNINTLEYLDKILSVIGPDNSAADVLKHYAKQYYLLFFRALSKKTPEFKPYEDRFENLLRTDLSFLPYRFFGELGSNMTLYATATSSIALEKQDLMTWAILQNSNSEGTSYFPASKRLNFPKSSNPLRDVERGAVARRVPFYISLIQHEKNPKLLKEYRQKIISSIHEYVSLMPYLIMYSRGLGGSTYPHLGTSGIGMHYLYATLPYTVSALRALLENKSLDSQTRQALTETETKMNKFLIRLQLKDSPLIPQETKNWWDHKHLLGYLSLFSFYKCGENDQSSALGILDPSLYEKLKTF